MDAIADAMEDLVVAVQPWLVAMVMKKDDDAAVRKLSVKFCPIFAKSSCRRRSLRS